MKRILSGSMALLILTAQAMAQNVGIGTSTPVEKLDVNGGLKIANSNAANPGTIRYNAAKNDFEGYNGKAWVSLTGGKGAWGNQTNYAQESDAANYLLNYINITTYGKGLGRSLSIHGQNMVVGAPFEIDDNGNSSPTMGGVIYFYWNLQTWKPSGRFIPLTFTGDDLTGLSVSHGGDKVVAGAPQAVINGNTQRGRVLVLPGYASGRDDFQQIISSDGTAGDHFGHSVAVSGNYILAGAPYKKIGVNNQQGKAYIYQPLFSTWAEMAPLVAPDGASGDNFGMRVAIDGNYAAVSAPAATVSINGNNYIKAGKVYLYQRSGSAWNYMTTLQATGGYDLFGSSLDLKNDTLVIGATQYFSSLNDEAGKVWVYVRSGNSWNLQATITAPDAKTGDAFGTSVHRNGDLLVVGAPQADVGASDKQGKAYVYRIINGVWQHEATLTASNGKLGDYFGMSVGITPFSAVVGAPQVDLHDRNDNGEVYFFKY